MASENKTLTDRGLLSPGDEEKESLARDDASGEGDSDDGFRDVLAQLAGRDLDVPFPKDSKIGKYVVEQELGSGGFGTVYRCRDPVIDKVVAIKVLRREFSLDPVGAERFLEEARAAARIGDEGIADVFDFGTLPDERRYLVMEYLEGSTLRELMTAPPELALSLDDKLSILEQVGRTLDAAHDAGVVHRDVKPTNVFVSRSSRHPLRTKLLDFGIAKRIDDEAPQRTSGQILGTPAYMSPEQCEGRAITPAADIYSFGVMAFELLTGKRPLNAASATALRAAHLRDEPSQASAVSSGLPRGVDAPLRAMLAKAPEERPSSASGPVREIRAAIATAQQRASRRVALGIGVVAALIGGALFLTLRRAPTLTPEVTARSIPSRVTVSSVTVVPSAAPAAVAPKVAVRVLNAPAGAAFRDEGGAQYDITAPIILEKQALPLRFTLTAPGYRSKQLELVPDRDQELDGRLQPLPASQRAVPAHKKPSTELEY